MSCALRMPQWAALGLALLVAASAGGQEVFPVSLTFVPPTSQVNRLDMDVTVTAPIVGSSSDSDTTQVSGIVSALLTVEFNAGTNEAVVSGLEFTGGRYTLTDVSFRLPFLYGLAGRIDATGRGLAGTLDTPLPPGPVSGTSFYAGDHLAILNEGVIHAEGTGTVGDYFDPTDINLADEPIEAGSNETGTLAVSLAGVAGGQADYHVTMLMPVDIDQSLTDTSGVSARLLASGTFRVEGSFSRALGVFGDFDGDGAVTAADVDLLAGRIPSASPSFDLDGSGAVDGEDMDVMIRDVLDTEYGDADLDGYVDHVDYLTVKAALAGGGSPGWAGGDFNGDHSTDGADFDILAAHFGWSAAPAALPEPGTLVLLAVLTPLLRLRRRRP